MVSSTQGSVRATVSHLEKHEVLECMPGFYSDSMPSDVHSVYWPILSWSSGYLDIISISTDEQCSADEHVQLEQIISDVRHVWWGTKWNFLILTNLCSIDVLDKFRPRRHAGWEKILKELHRKCEPVRWLLKHAIDLYSSQNRNF